MRKGKASNYNHIISISRKIFICSYMTIEKMPHPKEYFRGMKLCQIIRNEGREGLRDMKTKYASYTLKTQV